MGFWSTIVFPFKSRMSTSCIRAGSESAFRKSIVNGCPAGTSSSNVLKLPLLTVTLKLNAVAVPGFALGLGVTILALARWPDEPSGDDGVVVGGPIEATAAEGAVVDAEAPQPVSPIRQVTMSARIWTWLHVPRRVCRRPLSRSIVRETSRPASLQCLAGPPGVRLRADG